MFGQNRLCDQKQVNIADYVAYVDKSELSQIKLAKMFFFKLAYYLSISSVSPWLNFHRSAMAATKMEINWNENQ